MAILRSELTGKHVSQESEEEFDLSLNRILHIVIRRRWWVIGTTCMIGLAIAAVSLYLPNRYTSEATIFAVQQRVPERYVVPTATADPSQALEAMVQEVLSRPRLLSVIDELGLHPDKRQHLRPEELLELVRQHLTIEPLERMLGRGDVNAFKISFVAETPQLAQSVTRRLTTLFIEQNLKTRADQAATTSEFLHDSLEVARKDLQEKEQRLRDFKMQYLGELPEQHQGNLGILSSLQSQLENVMASQNQAQQQRLYLESLVSEYERRGKRSIPMRSSTGEPLTPLRSAENDMIRLQAEKKSLLAMYTPRHPDVLKKDKEIAQQQSLLEALRSARATGSEKSGAASDEPSSSEHEIVLAQMRSQLQANQLGIENLAKKEEKLRESIAAYERRLNLTPVREQQLTSMQRDYDLVKQHYGDLLKKEQESQLATDLEKRQEGQQFRLAEPPNLPTVPSSPKRLRMSLLGLLGGAIFGCALAFLVDLRGTSFRTEEEASRKLQLPLIVGVPLFLTPAEQRACSRWRAFEWFAACVLACVVLAAEFYVYRHG